MTLNMVEVRQEAVDELWALREGMDTAVDILTTVCAKQRSEGDIPRNGDRDEAVRWLIGAGVDPRAVDKHISTAVRVELDSGKLIQGV